MDGYLLDTNIVAYLYSEEADQHAAVYRRYMSLPQETPLYVSAITLGEIEFGHRLEAEVDTAPQRQFNAFLTETFPLVLAVGRSTRQWYGALRAKLFRQFAPDRTRRPKWPEDLVDPPTAKQLGIQENDLWLAAQALERQLVLVTGDRMSHLNGVTPSDFRIENWARE